MDVELYVYDLSRGVARSMSAALLGMQIDAVYHTAIVFRNVEYVYDGGIKRVQPGKTHLGPPLQVVPLGRTDLPMDVIEEYLESLESIYTAEAYDLWSHNCNNFSNDFATFLLGKGIPDHITNLPATVLNTPFGRMLRPQIDNMMQLNRQKRSGLLGIDNAAQAPSKAVPTGPSLVQTAQNLQELDRLLQAASKTCAIIFFTSTTCAPCAALYPLYDELAVEAGSKAAVIKVDTNRCFDISMKYSVRSTPTFITFLRGEQENRWSGGGPSTLRGNFNMLLQMAWPPHPHESLRLPTLRGSNTKPILYTKVPPLDRLLAKMGTPAQTPSVRAVKKFIETRSSSGAVDATLPDLAAFSKFLQESMRTLPTDLLFTAVDLFRVALVDPRFSGYYAEERDHRTVIALLDTINGLPNCPYSLRLVALQMCCNLFSSHLYEGQLLGRAELRNPVIQLVTTSLLDDAHNNVRVTAASVSFNLATSNWKWRSERRAEGMPDGDQVELVASLLEAVAAEEDSAEALRGYLFAFGYLVFCMPAGGELVDLLKTMDAQGTVLSKAKIFQSESLVREIGDELLGKGL